MFGGRCGRCRCSLTYFRITVIRQLNVILIFRKEAFVYFSMKARLEEPTDSAELWMLT
jgi:hypothetical protein